MGIVASILRGGGETEQEQDVVLRGEGSDIVLTHAINLAEEKEIENVLDIL
jgi:hypothetical protein